MRREVEMSLYKYYYLQEMCIEREFVFSARSDQAAIRRASAIKKEALTHISVITDEKIWQGIKRKGKFVPKRFVTNRIP